MYNISFTHNINPVTLEQFNRVASSLNNNGFVDYPWGVTSSKVKTDVFTYNICDCTAFLMDDGEKALLMHLSPLVSTNHDPEKIYDFIKKYFSVPNENLRAVIIGSNKNELSQDIFRIFIKFVDKFNIPVTILKTGKSPVNIAYRTSHDELLVSNKHITEAVNNGICNYKALMSGFDEIKISEFDEII